ncbi:aldose 1-epimerase family protein [Sphingomonas sp. CARO-RG-8B-R24-01]|uniref:aldose 1-epimerase family protein n=1 Tax=Sphingomonas sp. CARO-RG-8B-R24-01 TaxID=2914831 RepID=UPI001F57B533|nr:aldose 1-epimerase family protein [Sphingomonas sp. CARO-RG-8B-R24-01]
MADPLITIATPQLSAAINPLGAELTHLRDADGRELMTNADPAFWTGHAPLLFPIVGRLNGDVLHIDGTDYPMQQHGFARRSLFTLVEHSEAQAVFLLEDSAASRAIYPFPFTLRVTYTITDATLDVAVVIENRGGDVLPASFGFHPAFAWPLPYGLPRADHRIVFAEDEPEPLRELIGGGIAEQRRPSPLEGRTLALDDALFDRDALIWDQPKSRSVRYGAPTGPQLRVDFPLMPMLGIWTKPGAAFVCIEPWHGIADPQGFTGDIRDKPGIVEIAPGATLACGLQVTLEG